MNAKIYFLIALAAYTKANVVFENSTNLCITRCTCSLTNNNLTLNINCTYRNIEHTIANWPKHPTNLIATFAHNKITTLESMPGSDATNIQLIFSDCQIKYLNSGLFDNTVNVKLVDLSYNLLDHEQLSSDVFKGSYNNSVFEPIALEHLDLSYNQIHSLQKKIFVHTPQLRYLNLEGNFFRVLDHVTCLALSGAVEMQVLNLARNKLIDLPMDSIKHFPNLTQLNLAYNDLDFVPESLGYVAASLQVLNVSHNPIVRMDHTTFEGLENVLQLIASDLKLLTYVHAKSLGWLKRLKVLDLSHNANLLEIEEYNLEHLDKLQEVYLNNNGLPTLSPNLLPWSRLQIVDISNNDFVCDCDLYNISRQLSKSITNRRVPKCMDPRTLSSIEIYSLTNQTCSRKAWLAKKFPIDSNQRIMRVTLTTLVFVLILTAGLAVWIGYSKWVTYRRISHYPFPDQVLYRPVQNIFP